MRVIIVIALITVLVSLWLVHRKIREVIRRHGIHNLIGRAIVLRPHHGRYKTDATFWRASTDRASGKSAGRHHRAGWHNMCISITTMIITCLIAYGVMADLWPTVISTGAALVVLAALLVVLGVRKARRWHNNRAIVTPLAVAAELIIDPDRSMGAHPNSLITMEPGWLATKRGKIGAVALPDAFAANPGQREALEHLVSSRLPVPVRYRWQTSKAPRQLVMMAAPPMPTMIRFRDYLDRIEALKRGDFAVGLDTHGELYVASHRGDTPWHAKCANSGTGKSVSFQVKAAQILHQDTAARIVAIDTKQVSFAPLRGVPGIDVYDDPFDMASIYQAFYALAKIMKERYQAKKADPTAADTFTDIWLLVDEGNDLAVQLKAYYQNELRSSAKEPMQPPVWYEAIAPLLWQGREVGIRGEFMLQNLMEKYLGGMSLRPAFSTIGMAGYKPNQFRTIIGTTPIPECQNGPGRILMCRGTQETWVQSFYDDPDYLRAYAEINRRPSPTPAEVAKVVPMPAGEVIESSKVEVG